MWSSCACNAARFWIPTNRSSPPCQASNAFNSLKCEAALYNIQELCPSLSKIIINTYEEDTQLFIDGSTLYSQEGTTQSNPHAMAMYAVAITLLIHRLQGDGIKQAWYADDATAGGSLKHLRGWWKRIVELASDYWYSPNAMNTTNSYHPWLHWVMKLGTLWHYQRNMKALESLTQHILLPVFRKHHCSFCLSDSWTVTYLPSRGQSRTTKTKSKERSCKTV